MRRIAGNAVAWGLLASTAIVVAGGPGCSSTKPTELIPGVMTQMQLPRDIDGIEIEVDVNNTRTFCTPQLVTDGTASLPRTLGIVAGGNQEAIVKVIVRAFNDAQTNPATSYGCPTVPVAAGLPNGPTIVRQSTQTYVGQHELYLPMPLRFSCLNEGCTTETMNNPGHDFTCKGGTCVDVTAADVAAAKAVSAQLVDFTPSLVDGSDVCFSPNMCFPPSVPSQAWTAVLVDEANCVYGLPPGAPQGSGLNVRVFYDERTSGLSMQTMQSEVSLVSSGEVEILDEDPVEGFTAVSSADSGVAAPDAGDGGVAVAPRFKLAPGLCKLVHQATTPPAPPAGKTSSTYITISDVQVSALCPPKVTLLPICKTEQTFNTANLPDGGSTSNGKCNVAQPLEPTPSAVYMVMDDSTVMGGALGPSGSAKVLALSLTDPIFRRTSAAFTFLPHDPNECPLGSNTSAMFTPSIAFGPANVVQPEIAAAISNWVAPDAPPAPLAPLDLLAAMRTPNGAYDPIANLFNGNAPGGIKEAPDIAVLMFFVNRLPDPATNECPITTATTDQAFVDAANAAFAGIGNQSLRTFFVVLGNSADNDNPYNFYSSLVTEATPGAVTTIDARSTDTPTVLQNFSNVVTELGTCLYEAPTGIDTSTKGLELGYFDPVRFQNVSIPQDPSCSPATQETASGWNFDTLHRLRICGNAATSPCGALRSTITLASALALATGQSAPDIPVTATVLCPGTNGGDATTADAGASDAGTSGD
jgi:hypothetical protein